jgi:non-canonical (house-cleaning) NTP pyrophosphatase
MYSRYMKITICGSMQHLEGMKKAATLLESQGYEVETPNPREGEVAYDTLSDEERARLKDGLIREHLERISESDAVFIYNEDKKGIAGYIGGNTLMEMAFAFSQRIEIFLLRQPTGVSYLDEALGMKPIILDKGTASIDEYFQGLPKTYVSSKSPIKQRAVSRALRKTGIRTQVLPYPVDSSVSEEPHSIDETYEGAENRHAALKKNLDTTPYDYLATVESGLHQPHAKHGLFHCDVVILERKDTAYKTGITLGVEFPKTMTDKIPSVYPDLGILVQQEYGAALKDPIPYVTNGHLTRLQLVENAVFVVATQLTEEKAS